MTSEEILKAAQNTQEHIGEFEETILRRALGYGASLGMIMCAIMILFELLIVKRIDCGKPALIFAVAGCTDLYDGYNNKIRKKTVIGVIELIVSLLGILLYVGALMA